MNTVVKPVRVARIIGPIFIFNAVLFSFQALTKSLFPPMLMPLREAFSVGNTQVGLLVTLVFFGYALARFPSGIMADKIGCTNTVIIGSAAMAGSFIALSFAPNFIMLALMVFILGVSSGIYVTAGYSLAVIIGSRERAATATAAYESFGIVAGIISPPLVTFFVLYLDWHLLFFACGLLLAMFTYLFFRVRLRSSELEAYCAMDGGSEPSGHKLIEQSSRPKRAFIKNMLGQLMASLLIMKDPAIRRFMVWSTLVGGFGALSWTGIYAFIPTFLVTVRGLSYDLANTIFIIIPISGLLAKIATGWLADRFGNNPVMFVNLTASIALFIALTTVGPHWQLLMVLALLGATCLNTNTLINAFVLRNMPAGKQGAGFGLFSTAYTVIYSLGPYLTGFLSDSFGLQAAIRLSVFGAIIAAILILFSGKIIPSRLIAQMAAYRD